MSRAGPWLGPATAAGGILRLGGLTPETIDPAKSRDAISSGYAIEIFAGLTRVNADLQPESSLASGWNLTDSGRTYQFELRDGLQFHDGRPLTAEDVKWSWERALRPTTGSRTASVTLGNIEGADAVIAGDAAELSGVQLRGNRELEVRLLHSAAFFPALIAQGAALVVDRANVEQDIEWHLNPNGSGPYRLASLVPRAEVVLERSAAFVPRQAGPPEVRMTELDPGEDLLRYEQDQLDIVRIGGANVDRFTDPREPRTTQLRRTPTFTLTYLGFNTLVPPFNDHHARRAFAHAVDRARINRVTFRGHQSEARGVLPPGMPGHRPGYEGLPFDLDAARREIARSRHGPIEEWPELVFVTSGQGMLPGSTTRAIVEPWREQLAANISVEQFDFVEFLDVLESLADRANPRHVFLVSWVADFPDPFGFLDVLFGSDRPDNYGGFKNYFVDVLLDLARSERNAERRARAYGVAESRIIEQAAVVPISHGVSHELVQPWVTQYPGRPVVREWLTDAEVAPR